MKYPDKCRGCNQSLYGPVKYCPFCGTESMSAATPIAESITLQQLQPRTVAAVLQERSSETLLQEKALSEKGEKIIQDTGQPHATKEPLSEQAEAEDEITQDVKTDEGKKSEKEQPKRLINFSHVAVVLVIMAIGYAVYSHFIGTATTPVKTAKHGDALSTYDQGAKSKNIPRPNSVNQVERTQQTSSDATGNTEISREKGKITKVIETLYGAYKYKDLARYLSVIDDNAFFNSASYRLQGKVAIREKRVHSFSVLDNFDCKIEDMVVEIKGEEAIVRDTVKLTYTIVKTGKIKTEAVREMFKLTKKGERWYITENQEF